MGLEAYRFYNYRQKPNIASRRLLLLLLAIFFWGKWLDDGFDLSDALPDNKDKKPTATPKKPSAGDDFDLGDAVVDGGNDDPPPPNPPKPKPNPNPDQAGSSGSFSDADLADGVSGGEGKGGSDGGGSHRKEGEEADAPGVIPGIVGAVVVAVAGAISSFIAYQKKKLCFKANAEQGEVDMESHRNANAEPAVQRTLLEK
ncbi:PREDICTED: CD99 antigen [Colobus angolensis palliatus]|uniref:CD99 molecule (Xg blood group) n=1 Tax=Colobus angolensis palliatus TaxID=336983 RepID=A0A2K5JAX1_COLAP|nr:PREDICTED: CD99 antigen [Colobus angolensis palliatus]